MRTSSSVSPLELKARTTSPSATMPRSPCKAFNESRTTAGDPVLVSVDAILPPICPDLPTPTTTTLPRASTASLINPTARVKSSPNRWRSRCSSTISTSRRASLFPDNPFILTIVCRRSVTGKTLNRRNSDEEARDVRNFYRLRELGSCAVATNNAKENVENVYGEGREGPASPNPTADQERKYRWRSSARRARRESISDVESKGAAAIRNSRRQRGARSRHRKVERDQALHN